MHSTIAAFSSGVPIVPMAYSRKFNGLFIDTLDYNHLVDLKTDDNGAILDKIKDAFDDRDNISSLISNRLDGIVDAKKNAIISDLKEFFGINR